MANSKDTERSGSDNGDAKSGVPTADPVKVTGERKVERHEGTRRKVSITFMQNRKFDLHVGRETMTFLGRETKEVPRTWLQHPDFTQQSRLFVVKGV